jgi:TetR/AcrR family transcriptional regulator, transcriptional repressor for nem operon
MFMDRNPPPAREKLLVSALKLIRTKGYGATTVDDLCKDAGVTKGAFFHHFKTKEAAAIAATQFWNAGTGALFANADYHKHDDPLDQVIAYIDFRAALLNMGGLPEITCLLGTTVQETFDTNPALREACDIGITGHADTVQVMIEAAKARHAPNATWSAESLALHTQAVIQGAFILAKARDDVQLAHDSIIHLRRYFELLFHYAKED